MSAAIRQAIADAANTVEGIEAHPYYVGHLDPGTAFVRLERIDYPNPFGGIRRWNLVVLLPQDLGDAEELLEDLVPKLREALADELPVTEVTPQQLQINGSYLPCVFITGHRAEEETP